MAARGVSVKQQLRAGVFVLTEAANVRLKQEGLNGVSGGQSVI